MNNCSFLEIRQFYLAVSSQTQILKILVLGHMAKDDYWDTHGVYKCLESLSGVGRKKLFENGGYENCEVGTSH